MMKSYTRRKRMRREMFNLNLASSLYRGSGKSQKNPARRWPTRRVFMGEEKNNIGYCSAL